MAGMARLRTAASLGGEPASAGFPGVGTKPAESGLAGRTAGGTKTG